MYAGRGSQNRFLTERDVEFCWILISGVSTGGPSFLAGKGHGPQLSPIGSCRKIKKRKNKAGFFGT